jgi:hypothetical protein
MCALALLSTGWTGSMQARFQVGGWSEPYRLSSEAGSASEGYLVADQYGYVHTFWTETLFADGRGVLRYARFDGAAWAGPNEIYVANNGIANVSPVVDQNGTLHIAWVEGLNGPVYYTRAPAHDALSAQNWAPPIRIDIPAGLIRLQVDSEGNLHVLYIDREQDLGVYYIRSEDQGTTWSEPAWLDPDIPPDYTPANLNFDLDDADGLHAVWDYGALLVDIPNMKRVRYAHSLDGGRTWSVPFSIDQEVGEGDHRLEAASPVMTVVGQTVHVVWAAGALPYRHHRVSTDAGQTWSAPRQVFGELHGQAFDGLAVDQAGRVHFLGQIRYPQGIYHATWDQGRWTPPSLIYLISQDGGEIGDRIHAHDLRPVVRAGNQLVLAFDDPPAETNRRLFVMHRLLENLEPLEPVPTPTSSASQVPAPSLTPQRPTPTSTRTPQGPPLDPANQAFGPIGTSGIALTVALVPTLLLLAAVVAVWLVSKPRL